MSSSTNVFDMGKYVVVLDPKSGSDVTPAPPPRPLLIATPSQEGQYPILVFLHGYLFFNTFYSQLIQHIASHGFIGVAPQLYWITGSNLNDEIKAAAAITDWLSEGLQYFLPPLVRPNLSKLALTGHSRGGKTAFALALGYEKTSLKYSVLMGIDPVDGSSAGNQTTPPILTYVPDSFNLDTATLVIGSGLGEMRNLLVLPPCAPKDVNHKNFYEECQSPSSYFVVKDYGHNDMLDDETGGIRGSVTYCLCKNGKSRKPMRTFVGGIIVAYLEGDHGDLNAIKDGQEPLPVELQTVGFK